MMSTVKPGEVILVTGATGAIGFEIAAQAAAAVATVAVHGSRAQSVKDASERLQARYPMPALSPPPPTFTIAPPSMRWWSRSPAQAAGSMRSSIAASPAPAPSPGSSLRLIRTHTLGFID